MDRNNRQDENVRAQTVKTPSASAASNRSRDPKRLKSRKLRLRRKNRVRKVISKIYLCVALALILGGLTMASTVFFKIKFIRVTGNTIYSAAEIVDRSGLQYGDNLIIMDKYKVIDDLKAGLPYLEDVTIRRSFPDTILIQITESALIAAIGDGEGCWLVDRNGKLLEYVPERPLHVPEMTGVTLVKPVAGEIAKTEDSAKQEPFLALVEALYTNGLVEDVSALNLEKIYEIHFLYRETCRVIIGSGDRIGYACERLKSVLGEGELPSTVDFSGDDIRILN